MSAYPAVFDTVRPARFERAQVVLRLGILLVIGFLGAPLGWIFGLLYLGLPVVAAVLISARGGDAYLADTAPRLAGALRWFVSLYAYLAFLTDRFPAGDAAALARFEVTPAGRPTAGSALWRLLASLPEALVLALLGVVAWLIWLVAAVWILVRETYPAALYDFQRGVLRWQARLLAYHASLVGEYSPLAFDTGPEPAPPPAAQPT